MGDWGRYRTGNYHYQQVQRPPIRHQNRKPPPGSWQQPIVAGWEKNFCTRVCRIPWGRILDGQKVMSFYKDVLGWDDSAGEEAFHNAKSRYWAEINNRPCDITLPDPNLYIDEVDWNAEIDPELLSDLEREPEPPELGEEGKKSGLVADALYLMNQPVVCNGWGDIEEPVRTDDNPSSGAILGDCDKNNGKTDNPWEEGHDQNPWEGNHGGFEKNTSKVNNPWEEGGDQNPWEGNHGGFEKNTSKVNNPWEEGGDQNPREGKYGDFDKNTSKKNNPWEEGSNSNPWESNCGGCDMNAGKKNNPWEEGYDDGKVKPWKQGNDDGKPRLVPNAWGEASWSWGSPEKPSNAQWKIKSQWGNNNNNNGWEDGNREWENPRSRRQWNENWRKREGDAQNLSRYKTTRYQGDEYHTDHAWRNDRGRKRVSFSQENPRMDKKPLAQKEYYPVHACGPTSQTRSGNSWGWERQLS